MSHPSNDTLFRVAAGESDPGVTAHVRSCDGCAAKLRRLEGGAFLLREAKRSVPDISWSQLDAAMAREAEDAARAMRLSPPRAQRAWIRPLSVGLAFAAAAAVAVVAVRPRAVPESPVARREVNVPAAQPARAPFEGAVLLATAGATWQASPDAPQGPLAAAGVLREGGRIETEFEARAVITVQPGCRLDLRAESSATLRTLRQGEAVVELARGDVRVANAGGSSSVSVVAASWTIRADDAVVHMRGMNVARVVVLSGRAEMSLQGGSPLQFSGPLTVDLVVGGEAHPQETHAGDNQSLDLSAFRPDAALLQVPALDPNAVLSLGEGDVALPHGVEALRLPGPTTLRARTSRGTFTVTIGSGRVAAWTRVTTVAANAPAPPRPRVAPQPALTAPEPADPGLSPAQIAAVSRSAGMRIRHCFSTCVERNQCGPAQGAVRIQVQSDGRASLGAIPPALEGARRCLENDLQSFRGAQSNAPYDIAIGFDTRR